MKEKFHLKQTQMPKNKLRFLLFDLGDVLLEIDWTRASNKISLSQEEIFRICQSKEHDQYERGRISTQDFFSYLRAQLKKAHSVEEIEAAWCAIVASEIAGVGEVLADLKNDFKIFILSNTNRSHVEKKIPEFQFLKSVDGILTSCELGLRKPEPEIYLAALKKMEAKPAEVLFFDDKIENVTSARGLGIRAEVCYRSAKKITEIIRDSILTPPGAKP